MALATTSNRTKMITPTDAIHFSFSTPSEQQPSLEPTRKRARKSKYNSPQTSSADNELSPEQLFFSRPREDPPNETPRLVTPSVAKSHWSAEEDQVLREAQAMYGNSWMKISKLFPGRSEHAVKNRWNSWRKGKRGERRQHTCGAASGSRPVVQANKDKVVGIYKEFVAEQQQRENFFESVTFSVEDKLEMMKSVTRTAVGGPPAKEEDMVAQMASDMVAKIGSQHLSSLQEQQPLNDPLNSALESSLLWLDMPKLQQQLAQPSTPTEKSPLKLTLESNNFKDLTRTDRAAITRAVKEVSKAATTSSPSSAGSVGGGRKRERSGDGAAARQSAEAALFDGLAEEAGFELDLDLAELAAAGGGRCCSVQV